MVSDELQNLLSEKLKREQILISKPDTEWAETDLKLINAEIKELKAKEKAEEPKPVVVEEESEEVTEEESQETPEQESEEATDD